MPEKIVNPPELASHFVHSADMDWVEVGRRQDHDEDPLQG